MNVNLYTYINAKGPGARDTAYAFILETETGKGPLTLSKIGIFENVTGNQAELETLAAALKRINKPCMLTIYTDSVYVAAGFDQGRVKKWIETGWINAKGKPVANKEEWMEVADLLGEHKFSFRVKEKHSYYVWMQRNAEKEAEKHRKELEKENQKKS